MVRFGLIDKDNGAQVPIQSIDIKGKIHGYTAEVKATVEYKNNQDNPIEVIYILPLDEEAAVCGFQATIDGRTVVAEVQEKQEARDTYDDAISSGYSAFLLEESDETSDIFQINVGNLPAQKTATVEITFVTELPVEKEGRTVFVLPTVLNPRFCPPGSTSTTGSAERLASVSSKYAFEFELEVKCASEIQEIISPNSKIKVDVNQDNQMEATVSLDGEFKFDVDVEIHVLCRDPFLPHAIVEDGVTDDKPDELLGSPVVALNFLPAKGGSMETGEFVFVVDRSGSMSGARIRKAREALMLFLKSLPDGCYFNVVGFGNSFEKLFPQSKKYCDKTLQTACKHAENLQANLGGTRILEPLQDVFSQPLIKGCPRQVFLLTDGEVSNNREVIDEVRCNSNTARCFAFGIGEGASTALVKGVARAGQGTAEFINTNHMLSAKVIKTLRNALQAVLYDVKIEWDLPQGWSAKIAPTIIQSIFADNRLVVYGLLKKQGEASEDIDGTATLTASRISDQPDQPTSIKHEISFKVRTRTSSEAPQLLLHRLAAKRTIQELQDKQTMADDEKAQVIRISKAANVISKVTSFVAIDKGSHEPIPAPMTEARKYELELKASGLACAGLWDACEMASASAPKGKAKLKKKGGFSFPSFSFGGLFGSSGTNVSSSAKRKKQSKRAKETPPIAANALMACSFSADSGPYSAVYEYDPTIEDIPSSAHNDGDKKSSVSALPIIALQTASGAWKLTEELAQVLARPLKDLENACPDGVDTDAWATTLALAWLYGNCADRQDEWEIVEEKARKLLKKKLAKSPSSREVLEKAGLTLGVALPDSAK